MLGATVCCLHKLSHIRGNWWVTCWNHCVSMGVGPRAVLPRPNDHGGQDGPPKFSNHFFHSYTISIMKAYLMHNPSPPSCMGTLQILIDKLVFVTPNGVYPLSRSPIFFLVCGAKRTPSLKQNSLVKWTLVITALFGSGSWTYYIKEKYYTSRHQNILG